MWINPFNLAKKTADFQGTFKLSELDRLQPLLNSTEGEAEYQLHFSKHGDGKAYIHGTISAQLPLLCQRCGQEFRYALAVETRLQPVLSDEQALQVKEPYEPLLVNEDQQVELTDLVQEEIILALPMLPKHGQECLL